MTSAAARINEIRVAVMLLTRLPAGAVADPVPTLKQARWAFPIVGAGVGFMIWAAHYCAIWVGASPSVAALLALCAMVAITGALHLDGLADFADGIGGGRDRTHCLEIMRDSRIGSYGVVALIAVLGLWVASLASIEAAPLLGFVAIAVVSRFGMCVMLDLMPPARTDGLGQLAQGRDPGALILGCILSVLVLLPLGGAGLVVFAAMTGTGAFVAWRAMVRIQGYTGDVLGAVQISMATSGWVALSIAL